MQEKKSELWYKKFRHSQFWDRNSQLLISRNSDSFYFVAETSFHRFQSETWFSMRKNLRDLVLANHNEVSRSRMGRLREGAKKWEGFVMSSKKGNHFRGGVKYCVMNYYLWNNMHWRTVQNKTRKPVFFESKQGQFG